ALRSGRESFRQTWLSEYETQFSLLASLQSEAASLRASGFEAVLKTKSRVSEETGVALQSLKDRSDKESQAKTASLEDVWRQQRELELHDSSNRSRRSELKNEEDLLIAEIGGRSEDFRELAQTPSTREVQARLGRAALAEFVRFDDFD